MAKMSTDGHLEELKIALDNRDPRRVVPTTIPEGANVLDVSLSSDLAACRFGRISDRAVNGIQQGCREKGLLQSHHAIRRQLVIVGIVLIVPHPWRIAGGQNDA